MRQRFVLALLIGTLVFGNAVSGQADSIQWMSFEEGLEQGKAQNRICYVFFRADWCAVCHQMEKDTFEHRQVIDTFSEHFVAIRVDAEKRRSLAQKYGADKLPHSVFLSADGEVIAHRPAYIPPALFVKILQALIAAESRDDRGQ